MIFALVACIFSLCEYLQAVSTAVLYQMQINYVGILPDKQFHSERKSLKVFVHNLVRVQPMAHYSSSKDRTIRFNDDLKLILTKGILLHVE